VQRARSAQLHHDSATVVADDAQAPQQVQQVRAVAPAEERRGVLAQEVAVEVAQQLELVIAADAGDHGRDARVGEGGVQVGRSRAQGRTHPPGRGVLDRFEGELRTQPPQPQLERRGEHVGQAGRRRHHGDPAARRHRVGVHEARHGAVCRPHAPSPSAHPSGRHRL
jgi:hypothetical protein